MREKFPIKKTGDRLHHRHVNRLSRVARRFGKIDRGSFLNVRHTSSSFSIDAFPPFVQFTVTISDTKINDGDYVDSGLYRVKVRYYDHQEGEWATDADSHHELDATEFGMTGLSVGDKITAFWHENRGMFVPLSNSGESKTIHGTLVVAISSTDRIMVINNVFGKAGGNPAIDEYDLIPVLNSHNWDATEGAIVDAVWCQTDEQWEALQVDCPVPQL